jgi:hypothetical protein
MVAHGKLPQPGPGHDHKLACEFKEFSRADASTAGLTGSGPMIGQKNERALSFWFDCRVRTHANPGADVEASNEALAEMDYINATENICSIFIADPRYFIQRPEGQNHRVLQRLQTRINSSQWGR